MTDDNFPWKPTAQHWAMAETVAGSQFRYRSATDRNRVIERIAWALSEAEWTAVRSGCRADETTTGGDR